MEIGERKQLYLDMYPDGEVKFIGTIEDFDSAIVGITEDWRVVYDYERMLDWLVKNNPDIEDVCDAGDYLDYSILCYPDYLTVQ